MFIPLPAKLQSAFPHSKHRSSFSGHCILIFNIFRVTSLQSAYIYYRYFSDQSLNFDIQTHRNGRASYTACEFFVSLQIPKTIVISNRNAESLFKAGWQNLCGGTGGPRQKVWTRTKILSPNIRYFVAN